jgi:pantoate--beta-alanine ligase
MRTFQQISALRAYLRGIREEKRTVGFVPTMGALHAGHLSLMQRAKADCDIAVASIFVNPTQFALNEDLDAYPRDIQQDLQMAANLGVEALFMPDVEEMYPQGFQTWIEVSELTTLLEGEHRPTHFRGVATVVAKLLSLVQPNITYFGQKDYQQFLVIERMVRDLNLPVAIQMVPTARENDGLAMSSRNAYLTPEERVSATVLHRALNLANEKVLAGEAHPAQLQNAIATLIQSEPCATLDYVALVDPDTLQPVNSLAERVTLLALAVRIGNTRLIDNAFLVPEGITPPRMRISKPL